MVAVASLLSYIPGVTTSKTPRWSPYDDPPRPRYPAATTAAVFPRVRPPPTTYRVVIDDVLDHDSFLKLRATYTPTSSPGSAVSTDAPWA